MVAPVRLSFVSLKAASSPDIHFIGVFLFILEFLGRRSVLPVRLRSRWKPPIKVYRSQELTELLYGLRFLEIPDCFYLLRQRSCSFCCYDVSKVFDFSRTEQTFGWVCWIPYFLKRSNSCLRCYRCPLMWMSPVCYQCTRSKNLVLGVRLWWISEMFVRRSVARTACTCIRKPNGVVTTVFDMSSGWIGIWYMLVPDPAWRILLSMECLREVLYVLDIYPGLYSYSICDNSRMVSTGCLSSISDVAVLPMDFATAV